MATTTHPPTTNRRRFCTAAVATAVAAGAGVASVPRVGAQAADDLEAWLADVPNYDGVVDATGEAEVKVDVGVPTAAGPFGFGPAAVRVDPGTTVVWEWTGAGGVHDVTAVDGSFGTELVDEAGHTYTRTFDAEGVVRYVCTPHEPIGMMGAIVVGDVDVGGGEESAATGEPDYGDWFDDVGNYEATLDARGRDAVTVDVGVMVDGVPFGFGPAALRVDPGTTVTWEWTGAGGSHDVSSVDGAFASQLIDVAGHTFDHTFEEIGIHRYVCTPHERLGMKGAVVVGDQGGSTGDGADRRETLLVGGVGGAMAAALFVLPLAALRRSGRRNRR